MTDPVKEYDDGWYFWDETWAEQYGPYRTEAEAREELDDYVKNFLERPKS